MRYRPSSRLGHAGVATVALGLAVVSAAVVYQASGSTALVDASANACGRVQAAKCAAMQTVPVPATAAAQSAATPAGAGTSSAFDSFWLSPALVQCGSAFFSSSTAAALTAHFGSLSCFRFSGGSTWVVVGSGLPATGSGVAPGGEMVATDTCEVTDTVCLDANAQHDFTAFAVYYPPEAATAQGEVETTFGSRLLYFRDGSCGLFVFDLQSGNWYPQGDVNEIMSGATNVTAVAAPSSIGGGAALSVAAPQSTGACQ